jgi:hypothetical protein
MLQTLAFTSPGFKTFSSFYFGISITANLELHVLLQVFYQMYLSSEQGSAGFLDYSRYSEPDGISQPEGGLFWTTIRSETGVKRYYLDQMGFNLKPHHEPAPNSAFIASTSPLLQTPGTS